MNRLRLSFFAVFLFPALMASAESDGSSGDRSIPGVSDYFDDLQGDMTKLTWAHAVNDQSLLKKALDDAGVMMLEADIVLGTLKGGNETIPIMAHPPKNESDLSLKQFLDGVIGVQGSAKKGAKLDFKTTEAFVESLNVIESVGDKLTFPVWLNADILKGPVDSDFTPVDAKKFLGQSARTLPNATLSLGWTTKYGPNITGIYTDAQINDMKSAITEHGIRQPVTLAVRAGIAAQGPDGIKSLVEEIDEYQNSNATTITIWMSNDSDPVDVPRLRNLTLTLGKSKIFLDVPQTIRNQLDLDDSSGSAPVARGLGAPAAVLASALSAVAFR